MSNDPLSGGLQVAAGHSSTPAAHVRGRDISWLERRRQALTEMGVAAAALSDGSAGTSMGPWFYPENDAQIRWPVEIRVARRCDAAHRLLV